MSDCLNKNVLSPRRKCDSVSLATMSCGRLFHSRAPCNPERSNSRVTPNMLKAQYLENGWRQRLRFKAPPIGNGPWGTNWMVTWPTTSHDPERSSRDRNTLRVQYCENSCRCYLATIANLLDSLLWASSQYGRLP